MGNPRSVLMKREIFININQIGAVWRRLGAVKRMRTRIGLLAQPESMRSIGDATQREQRYGSA